MNLRRTAVIPVALAVTTMLAVPYSAKPVEAMTGSASPALVKRVFDASNFPLDPASGGQAAAALPDGKGKELVQQKCVTCHAANLWMSQRHTKDQWGTVLDTMMSRGLEASDEELETMANYLGENFGPVTKDAPPTPAAPASDPASPKPPAR